ncbi:hypothetical protein CALCODRAFT_505193 [Calocera cornea HHB12733]|uniref:F-box domain-containing protein n=1 Tax=Calocera cornea HHB12733 TaxID=1353952 RepID=A0A166JFJ6_9BASI|nr:hypothetical protein CALCODRAFT_505193 [Calocera cornea HHB12733]
MLTAPNGAVGRLLAQMSALLPGNRTLVIGNLPLDVLPIVAALPWQACTNLCVSPDGGRRTPIAPPAWPRLRRLIIGLCTAEQAVETLACFTTASLASLTILADEPRPADDPAFDEDDIFGPLMALAGAHANLVELHVSAKVTRPPLALSGRLLTPLVGCTRMRTLAFAYGIANGHPATPRLGLAAIHLLASAWPQLTEFIVCHPYGSLPGCAYSAGIAPAGVDLGVIHVLQTKCPLLRTLQLVECAPGSLVAGRRRDLRHITVRVLCTRTSVPSTLKSLIKTIWPQATVWVDASADTQGWNVLQTTRMTTELRSHTGLDW